MTYQDRLRTNVSKTPKKGCVVCTAAIASIATTTSKYKLPCPPGEVCDDLPMLSRAW